MHPVVSIIIPCYNGAKYLPQAIESCLSQDYRDIEIIVVNDASPDDCLVIGDKYSEKDPRVKTVNRSVNGGICRALNSGIEMASGQYMTRLAQDDWFRPDAIGIMADALRSNPDAGLVYCNVNIVDDNGKLLTVLKTEPPEKALFPVNRVGLCVMWRKEVSERIGGFDPRCEFADDYDYWLRISEEFRLMKCSDEAPFFFRYHREQMSIKKEYAQRANTEYALLKYWRGKLRKKPLTFFNHKKVLFALIKTFAWKIKVCWRQISESSP